MKLWTTLEEKKLRELFPVYKTKDVAKMMNRTYRSVRDKAYDLRLKKEFDFSDLFLPGNKIQPFKKGEWPKGCERTWFKKGNAAHKKPIGTESIRWGALFVKVSDNALPEGNNRQKFLANWKRKKNIVWEQHFGPIPEKHHVVIKDGDQMNCSIENLMLVHWSKLHTCAHRPKEKWSQAAKKAWETRRGREQSKTVSQTSTRENVTATESQSVR